MNNLFKLIGKAGIKVGSKAKALWSKMGSFSTAKIARWATANKGWLQTIGLASISAATGTIVSGLISSYMQSKEAVAQRWIDATGESTPEAASNRKRAECISEIRDIINSISGFDQYSRDDDYASRLVRLVELVNFLVHNESDDEARRIAVRAASIIPGCLDAGVYPEEGCANPMVMRALRNLSEDALTAEDIEGAMDCVLDVAESGAPLKAV